ncbi:ERG4/ERG24 ergosterol biosynthesis protein [Epithele typhae]|uniref:ERG4/ERG24 ergosterol biosynthesis protein n=1 Tax=Epithele typhae TaxID=378194 RepID=UPI002008A94E|nr:ERG4/ERG24 ergosterol biosynthesis protein [Epithele typhae]KAH9924677.1 ERG4/ERG24 ergosterol biosynthesis protein [Epithele typhae]
MSSSSNTAAELNPRTTKYEFFGPIGAFAVSFGVPVTTYALYFGCSEQAGGCHPPIDTEAVINSLSSLEWWKGLFDKEAFVAYFAWYAFTVAAWAILPGDWVSGVQMRNGQTKQYKINGFATMLLALGLTAGVIYRDGPAPLTFIYDHWIGLQTAALTMSILQAFYVYASSYRPGALLALAGNSGNFLYDWFIGRELNPSIGSFDIKSFNEVRPGLILWFIIDIAMACEQAVRRGGTLADVTDSMWLVLAFQGWYVADCLYNEPAILTTMDITTDGFGFMLSVGDLAWVPFVYSLQARYLVFNQVELGPIYTGLIFTANLLGYYIFRGANGEKNDFRNGRNPKNLKFMTTESGRKLLTSGWWGLCRHPNYMGDLIMAFSWSLPTGFSTPITYFYVAYFLVLLIHRQMRDDEACEKKYGKDWHKYTQLVPYRIFPYIY